VPEKTQTNRPGRSLVLINPPAIAKRYLKTKFMPFGTAVLYAYLKEQDLPVVQHDFLMDYLYRSPDEIDYFNPEHGFSQEDFLAALRGEGGHPGLEAFARKYTAPLDPGAAIYAFSIVAYHQYWAALLLAGRLRRLNPAAAIVFGGPFVTIRPLEALLAQGGADYFVKGSGEVPLKLLYEMLAGRGGVDPADVPGLVYFQDGQALANPKSELPAEEERPPDFEGLDLEAYRFDHPLTGPGTLFLPYRLAKGCPSRCSFCTGRLVDRFSLKSADKVLAELKGLAAKYGSTSFMFADAAVNGHPGRFEKILDRLGDEFPEIRWYGYSRIGGFTPAMLRKAKRAGCFSLFWGVESAHQPTVNWLGKGFKVERIEGLLDAARQVGIKSYVHLMFNTPHETEADIAALIRLLDRYLDSDDVVFMPMRFLLEPESLVFSQPDKYGLADISPVEAGPFERDEYLYGEAGGPDWTGVAARNEAHRRLLQDRLDLIRYKRLLGGIEGGLFKRLPARQMVRLGRLARRSGPVRVVHRALLNRIKARSLALREQL